MRALVLSLAFAVSGCSGPDRVAVGSKNFTEQVLLGEILAQLLEARGVAVERRLNLGGTFICHEALISGDLDIYVEYSGTALTAILKEPVQHDPGRVYELVRERYRDELGLEWSAPLGFNNTFALVMRPAIAQQLGIRRISDLVEHQTTLRPGVGHEFLEREDGYRGLVYAYGLEFDSEPRGMELGLIYQALAEEQVDLIAGSSTDGLIEKFDLVVLEDDRKFFPPYDAGAVFRPETGRRHPEVREVVGLLEDGIDEPTMRRLNRLVDDEGRSVREVVADLLRERGWDGS